MSRAPHRHGVGSGEAPSSQSNDAIQGPHPGVGICTRRLSCLIHEGTSEDFLRRYRCDVELFMQDSGLRTQLMDRLLECTADSRNLYCAWQHQLHHGGRSAGVDGLHQRDLERLGVWEMIRVVSRAIKAGPYRPNHDNLVEVPKASGTGTRILTIPTVIDRMVQRAIVQIIQPILDREFDDCSFGYRPGRNRLQPIARATALAQHERRWVWVVVDLKNAFDNIPLRRLLDIIQPIIPNDDMLALIRTVVRRGPRKRKGLRQGGGLSPLLLNAYLHHFLDRRWRRSNGHIPMIRVADDILILCQTLEEGQEALESIRRRMREAGMPLKATRVGAIHDLRGPTKVEWVGFSFRCVNGLLDIGLKDRTWVKLSEKLLRRHDEPDAPVRAGQTLRGWLAQQGPAYKPDMCDEVLDRVERLAKDHGFDEIPPREELRNTWNKAHRQWCHVRNRAFRSTNGGSANNEAPPAGDGRAPAVAERAAAGASSLPADQFTLYCAGYCRTEGARGPGGWSYVLHNVSTGLRTERANSSPRTSSIRMELLAVIRGLELTSPGAAVHVVTANPAVASILRARGIVAGPGTTPPDSPSTNAAAFEGGDLVLPHS
jgi:group II intron reverse transcriptase/maturase